MIRPDLSARVMELDLSYVNGLLGTSLSGDQVKTLLEKMRHGAASRGRSVTVRVPPYRADIMHPIDLVEDVAIAYGYMDFVQQVPRLYALGRADPFETYCEEARDFMIGLQFREVMTLMLSNPRDLYARMNVPAEPAVEAQKPVSAEQGTVRTWLLPSLMVVLEKNRNREYPQMLFEVGDVLDARGATHTKIAGVIAHAKTNFSEIKAAVGGLLESLRLKSQERPQSHSSFIEGRCLANDYGFLGELSPVVLSNFGIDVPVTAFELKLCRRPSDEFLKS